MADAPALPLDWRIAKDYDLPPRWDGLPIEWAPWQPQPWSSLEIHRRGRPEVCERCGSQAQPSEAHGGTPRRPAALRGREAPPVVRLIAYRCPGCGLDTVLDVNTWQWWTLDATDYGPFGSVG